MMKYKIFLSFDNLIFLLIWLLLFWAGRDKLFQDPGTFFHTAIGEKILNTEQLPYTDIFTFTHYGDKWIAQQWLGDCIMAFIHRLAGLDGLLVLAVSLISILYALLALRIERSGMNLMLGSLLLFCSLAVTSPNLHVRPHLFTMLFMAVLFSKLCDIDMKRASEGSLAWLIPFFVIWANIHGGALGGLCTLLLTVGGWTLACQLGWHSPIRAGKVMFVLWGLTFLCFLTTLINPYFQDLPLAWLKIMGSQATAELIEEHASVLNHLRHGDAKTYLTIAIFFCLGFFYFALLAGTDKKDRRITWYIPLIWLILSFSRIRHAPLFSVVSVIAIAEMFPFCYWIKSLDNRGYVTFQIRIKSEVTGTPSGLKYILPALIVALALLACRGSNNLPSTAQNWVILNPAHWPVDVLPELKEIEKDFPNGTPIFNDMLFGGFLIYHIPGFRVFIDDRCELYEDEFLWRYVNAKKNDFDIWSKQYPFDFALLKINSNYRKYFENDRHWRVLRISKAAVLYRKFIP